jgi:hypothetical protein
MGEYLSALPGIEPARCEAITLLLRHSGGHEYRFKAKFCFQLCIIFYRTFTRNSLNVERILQREGRIIKEKNIETKWE